MRMLTAIALLSLQGCIATRLETETVTLTRVAIATDVRIRAKGPGMSIDEEQGQASLERLIDAAGAVLDP
jgi:hypothetical protein